MRKTAYFFLSFTPLVAAVGIQYVAMLFVIGMSILFTGPGNSTGGDLFSAVFDQILSNSDFSSFVMIIYSLLVICTFGILYYRFFDGDFLPKPAATFHPLQLLAVVLLVPGAQYACNFITAINAALFPSAWEAYEELFESAGLTGDITFILFCYSVILAPICEELIFRGLTLRCAKVALPFWLANLLQAVLFGVFHMNFIQGCYAAALGILLGIVCEKGGSIYYSMFLHFLFNLWGIMLAEFFYLDDEEIMFVVMIVVTIVSLVVGLLLFFMGDKLKKRRFTGKYLLPAD